LSRVAVADALGITTMRLFNIERCKQLLRFELADRICRMFDINQRWLSMGEGDMRLYVAIPADITSKIKPSMRFSAAYREILKEWVDRKNAEFQAQVQSNIQARMAHPPGVAGKDYITSYCIRMVTFELQRLPDSLYWPFCNMLIQAMLEFHRAHQLEIGPADARKSNSTKHHLTPLISKDNVSGMKFSLNGLLDRLERACAPRGKKAMLAKRLKVTAPQISEWIHGVKEPGGKITLALLDWVILEEARQQENRGSVETPPRRKTRSPRSHYDKSKPDPQPT
jgi:hypothetical protein